MKMYKIIGYYGDYENEDKQELLQDVLREEGDFGNLKGDFVYEASNTEYNSDGWVSEHVIKEVATGRFYIIKVPEDSWSGAYWDSVTFFEGKPVEKTITVWEPVDEAD